jgi:hypothetical protein
LAKNVYDDQSVSTLFIGWAVYEGEFSGPSRIKGAAFNIEDKKWTFELTQITKPAEIKRYEAVGCATKL